MGKVAPGEQMVTVAVRLDPDLIAELDEEKERIKERSAPGIHITRSDVIRVLIIPELKIFKLEQEAEKKALKAQQEKKEMDHRNLAMILVALHCLHEETTSAG